MARNKGWGGRAKAREEKQKKKGKKRDHVKIANSGFPKTNIDLYCAAISTIDHTNKRKEEDNPIVSLLLPEPGAEKDESS